MKTMIMKKGSDRKIMLYKNFRSREEVVDCANYIFENTNE